MQWALFDCSTTLRLIDEGGRLFMFYDPSVFHGDVCWFYRLSQCRVLLGSDVRPRTCP